METNSNLFETPATETLRDSSGYRYFSAGETGAAHAMAHQMLDAGRYQLGHDLLKDWLVGRVGQGSQWVHVQWHMMVFELAVGEYRSAEARFHRYIVPAATTGDALTDAPAALWRLALASDRPVDLPWEIAHAAAVERLWDTDDTYVALHNLLALAGAGDVHTIDRWLASHVPSSGPEQTLELMGFALRSFASGDYAESASAFAAALPGISQVGGSRAQNELFTDIYRLALERASADSDTDTDTDASAVRPGAH